MGRRSRQRIATPVTRSRRHAPGSPPRAEAPLPTAARGQRRADAPTAPWGSFPLIELCALAAIVLGVWGMLRGGHGGGVLLAAAALLGSVAGLEVAIREHLGGFRSHTLVLSGVLAVATLAVLFFAHAGRTAMLAIGGGVLVAGLLGWRELFKRRSGGVGFRVH